MKFTKYGEVDVYDLQNWREKKNVVFACLFFSVLDTSGSLMTPVSFPMEFVSLYA